MARQRVVSVVALHAENDEGDMFVQLGKWSESDDDITVAVELPGGKQERGELPFDSIQRLFKSKLVFLRLRDQSWEPLFKESSLLLHTANHNK